MRECRRECDGGAGYRGTSRQGGPNDAGICGAGLSWRLGVQTDRGVGAGSGGVELDLYDPEASRGRPLAHPNDVAGAEQGDVGPVQADMIDPRPPGGTLVGEAPTGGPGTQPSVEGRDVGGCRRVDRKLATGIAAEADLGVTKFVDGTAVEVGKDESSHCVGRGGEDTP
jgi:hypothetical protein